ncbi:maleylpyruvate isomerase family mycothiol-dependent enzyme [Streptosporangium canum]|uniref:maleylpyruvate isomerase family mycothiol-dependent enzyme n=1 Tax=Streptosporangium canum TaxID=324952 RepID=UPI00369F0B67
MMELIAAGRRELANVLGGLSADQWQAPSLCAGWAVAHVVAHVTMPFRISEREFMLGIRQAGGRFTEFSDAVASRDSRLPQTELVAALRDNADHPWSPPGGGPAGALSHDTIHGLDITRPLSIKNPIPDEAMITVLDLTVGQGSRSLFGVDLDGIELRATDLDWSSGSGAPLEGRSLDLLPFIAGRRIPHDVFSGPGARRLGGPGR